MRYTISAALGLLFVLFSGPAQAQTVTVNYADYANVSTDGTYLYTSVVVDGTANMNLPRQMNIVPKHTATIYNKIGGVGGWTSSAAAPCSGTCYTTYQSNESLAATQGTEYEFDYTGEIFCSYAGLIFSDVQILAIEIAYTRVFNTGILAGTTTVNGQPWNVWRTLPYCTPQTSPPDWSPSLYYASATHPYTDVFYIDGVSACVRINLTGVSWSCIPGASIGWPQSLNLLPANCTHHP